MAARMRAADTPAGISGSSGLSVAASRAYSSRNRDSRLRCRSLSMEARMQVRASQADTWASFIGRQGMVTNLRIVSCITSSASSALKTMR